MLFHIVCFKYKNEIEPAKRREHREKLGALAGLPGIIDLKVGEDVVRSERSYDTGLIVTFRDRAALDAYQQNPVHVTVAQFGVSLTEHIVSADFEG